MFDDMTVEEAHSELSRASKGTMETVEKQQPRSRARRDSPLSCEVVEAQVKWEKSAAASKMMEREKEEKRKGGYPII